MRANAFHEKARRSQVFSTPSSHCRHASIRTLEEQLVSLGAGWAFSVQPVLPSDCRPVVLLLRVERVSRAIVPHSSWPVRVPC